MRIPKKITPSPITEAIFELRLNSGLQGSELFAKIFPALSADFPSVEPLQALDFPPEMLKRQPELKYAPQYRFRKKNFLVTLGPKVLSINNVCVEDEYAGWDTFAEVISGVLKKIKDLGLIDSIEQASLKYINLFKDDADVNRLNIEVTLLEKKTDSLSQLALITSSGGKDGTSTNIGIFSSATLEYNGEQRTGMSINLEVVNTKVETIENAIEEMDNLHDRAQQAFFGLLKPEFIESLSPTYE